MKNLAILNARILPGTIDNKHKQKKTLYDVKIENGKIHTIAPKLFADNISQNMPVINADGNLLLPGAIDLHVKAANPLKQIAQRAAQSGITSVVMIPTPEYPLDTPEAINSFFWQAQHIKNAKLYPAAALTRKLAGQIFSELGLLSHAGAVFWTQADQSLHNNLLFFKLCQYSQMFAKPIFHSPIDHDLYQQGPVHASQYADWLGITGHTDLSEILGIFRDFMIAKETKSILVHDRVSTKKGLKQYVSLKQKNTSLTPLPKISCALYNLFFNTGDLNQHDPHAKTYPPLREEEDRKALLAALAKGEINYIVSGDAHFTPPAPTPFLNAPLSTKSMEYLWPVGLTLAQNNAFPFEHYIHALTRAPAELLHLPQGRLAPKCPADLVILDSQKPVRPSDTNSLFSEQCLQGMVLMTLVDGNPVYQQDDFAQNTNFQRRSHD